MGDTTRWSFAQLYDEHLVLRGSQHVTDAVEAELRAVSRLVLPPDRAAAGPDFERVAGDLRALDEGLRADAALLLQAAQDYQGREQALVDALEAQLRQGANGAKAVSPWLAGVLAGTTRPAVRHRRPHPGGGTGGAPYRPEGGGGAAPHPGGGGAEPVQGHLRRGDSGPDVRTVQRQLMRLGYTHAGVDGRFDHATEHAVREFQRDHGLEVTGVVGPALLARMRHAAPRLDPAAGDGKARHGGEWKRIIVAVKLLGLRCGVPSVGQTTGGHHASASLHYEGRAVDFVGVATSDSARIARALAPYAKGPDAPICELIFNGTSVDEAFKNGSWIGAAGYGRATWQEHHDHVHVGVRAGVDLAAVVAGVGAG